MEFSKFDIKEYKTVWGLEESTLDEQVNYWINLGWIPYGNPYVVKTEKGNTFYNQAMIEIND